MTWTLSGFRVNTHTLVWSADYLYTRGALEQDDGPVLNAPVSRAHQREEIPEMDVTENASRRHWLAAIGAGLGGSDAAARVRGAGGRVAVAPRPDLLGGRVAVFVDPGGAPLGVLSPAGGAS